MTVMTHDPDLEAAENCYCVCHSPFSSRPVCDHCKGENEVMQRARERRRQAAEAAKESQR